MKIETTAGSLALALKVLQRIVPKRGGTIPILNMAKFEDGRITVTDLDRVMSVVLPHSGFAGVGLLPYWRLKRLTDAMGADSALRMESLEQGGTLISCGAGRYVLPSLPAADFPEFRPAAATRDISGDLDKLRDAIAYAAPIASRDETRYYLNGVCLSGVDVASTDGHRLAMVEGVLDAPVENVIIPNDAVRVVLDMPRIEVAKLHVRDDGVAHRVQFDCGGVRLTAKLIDGNYPDVRRVIPTGNEQLLRLGKTRILGTLKRLSAISDGRHGVSLSSDGARLAIGSIGLDRETGYEEIDCSGDAIDTGFNGIYFAQVMRQIDGDDIAISFMAGDPFVPFVLRGEAKDRFIVMMPLRRDTDLLRVVEGRGILPPDEKKKAA